MVPAAKGGGMGTCSKGRRDGNLQQRGGEGERGRISHTQKASYAATLIKQAAQVHVNGAPIEASQ